MTDALPPTNAAEEKTRFSVGGGRGGCPEYRTKDVAMTSPMAAKTTTRNHRWETEDGSDTGPYAIRPRLKLSRGSEATFLSKTGESPAASPHRLRESSLGEEPDNPGPKWARPDLDWRPSGYQPDAPTRLSYGPARRRKTTNRLKHSFEVRLRTPGHPLIASRAATSPRRPRIVTP